MVRVRTKDTKYSPNPVLWPLAEYYIDPEAYKHWENDPLEFKEIIKNYLIDHVNKSVEPFVGSLPFLKFSFPKNMHEKQKHLVRFSRNLEEFLDTRKIARVIIWNIKGFKGDLVPLTNKEMIRRTGKISFGGGFEIGLGYQRVEQALTTLSHEIGHTYFYDLSKDPPECLVSNSILKIDKWQREFEGMAFDIGRGVILPRKSFTEYVFRRYRYPSIKSFLEMHSKLKVSKALLSQRLIKDLRIWKACIFWGKISAKDIVFLRERIKGPHILVKKRDKKKSFRSINIKAELANHNSELRKAILKHSSEEEKKECEIKISRRTYKFDMKSGILSQDEKWFIALLYQ